MFLDEACRIKEKNSREAIGHILGILVMSLKVNDLAIFVYKNL